MPPEQRQETGKPGMGTQSASVGQSAQGTRKVTRKEVDEGESEPPQQSKAENAIVNSDDSDGTVRSKTRVSRSQGEPTPSDAFKVGEGKEIVPPGKTEARESKARETKEGDLRRMRSPSVGRFRVREQVRQVWGNRYQAGGGKFSLPRPRELAPTCHKSVRKADVPVSRSYVSWTEHPEYILNKAKARGDYSHIAGTGVPVFNVDVSEYDDVNVVKNVAKEVSEVTHADAQLKQGIDQMTRFIKKSEALKTDKKLLAEQNKSQKHKKKKILEKKDLDNFSDVKPDDPVSADTNENANVLAKKKIEKAKTSENEPDFESVVAETVVISSDAENTDGNEKAVSSHSDADLRDIEM